jgi:rsbT co-antagonist protein RsbR
VNPKFKSSLPQILSKYESEILASWLKEQIAGTSRKGLMKEEELRTQSASFLQLVRHASQEESLADITTPGWAKTREMLTDISRSRSHQGFSPSETANFVFSIRAPLLVYIRQEFVQNADVFADESLKANLLIDKLGLFTTEVYQKAREEVINRQQADMLELSTPVVTLWDGILALPRIGTLDSARSQVVMETLLQRIVETGAEIAIIDITGVPTVDTLVAQHLLKTITAARLMGAECIISGIRPQIAATIVHLGVDLSGVITKSTLRDAFSTALTKLSRNSKNPASISSKVI